MVYSTRNPTYTNKLVKIRMYVYEKVLSKISKIRNISKTARQVSDIKITETQLILQSLAVGSRFSFQLHNGFASEAMAFVFVAGAGCR